MIADYPLPWPLVPLSAVARLIRGVSFSGEEFHDSPRPEHLPVLRAGNISDRLITDSDLVWVPQARVSAGQRLRVGDIAICMSSGSSAVVGKTAPLENDWEGCVGAFCAILRPSGYIDPRYLAAYLKGLQFTEWRKNQAQGANILNLRGTELLVVPIPVPPLSEQQRLVEILQEAESIRRLRAEAEAKTAEMRLGLFGDTIANYKGEVNWVRIGDVLRVKSGVFLSANMMKAGPYPVYGGNGVNGHHDAFIFTDSTVCIGRVGAYCGAVHLTDPCSWITDNALYVSELLVDLDVRYLAQALTAAQLNQYASQGGQPLISAGRIYPVKIPLLPIRHQQLFSDAVTEIEGLQSENAEMAILGAKLESSLSAHAFSGQLTADWREAHAEKLAVETRERDAALKQTGAMLTRSVRGKNREEETIFEQRTDGNYSDLNREQRHLLFHIQQRVGGVSYVKYFTAHSLSPSLEGPLRRNPHAIDSHLAVFAARGIVIPVSREEQTDDTGEFVFGNAYRLPLKDRSERLTDEAVNALTTESGKALETEGAVGDYSRGRELERLAAQLEKERTLA